MLPWKGLCTNNMAAGRRGREKRDVTDMKTPSPSDPPDLSYLQSSGFTCIFCMILMLPVLFESTGLLVAAVVSKRKEERNWKGKFQNPWLVFI